VECSGIQSDNGRILGALASPAVDDGRAGCPVFRLLVRNLYAFDFVHLVLQQYQMQPSAGHSGSCPDERPDIPHLAEFKFGHDFCRHLDAGHPGHYHFLGTQAVCAAPEGMNSDKQSIVKFFPNI